MSSVGRVALAVALLGVLAALNLGAVFLESDDPGPRAAFADARCAGGTLIVSRVGAAPRDLPSRILDHVLGDGNLHAIEVQLFFVNLRRNAAARVDAFSHAEARPNAGRWLPGQDSNLRPSG